MVCKTKVSMYSDEKLYFSVDTATFPVIQLLTAGAAKMTIYLEERF